MLHVRPRHLTSLIRTAAIAAVLAGCSTPNNSGPDPALNALVDQQFTYGTVPAEIREILVGASRRGEVTFSDYGEAASYYEDCLTKGGLKVSHARSTSQGMDQYEFSVTLPADVASGSPEEAAWLQIDEGCRNTWLSPVASVYIAQPRSVQAREADFDQFRAATLACLKRIGADVPPDAHSYEEIDLIVAHASSGGVNCLDEAGYFNR